MLGANSLCPQPDPWRREWNPLESKFGLSFLHIQTRRGGGGVRLRASWGGGGRGLKEPLRSVRPAACLSAASPQLPVPLPLPLFPHPPSFNLISVFLSIFQLPSDGLFYRQPPICPQLLFQEPAWVSRKCQGTLETTHTHHERAGGSAKPRGAGRPRPSSC